MNYTEYLKRSRELKNQLRALQLEYWGLTGKPVARKASDEAIESLLNAVGIDRAGLQGVNPADLAAVAATRGISARALNDYLRWRGVVRVTRSRRDGGRVVSGSFYELA